MRTGTYMILMVLLVASSGWAQLHEESSLAIESIIEPQVLLVGHINVQEIDLDRVKQLADVLFLSDMPVEIQDRYTQARDGFLPIVAAWQNAFLEAGGTEIYVVFSLAYELRDMPVVLAVPLGPEVDADAIGRLISLKGADAPAGDSAGGVPVMPIPSPATLRKGRCLLAGSERNLAMLAELEPSAESATHVEMLKRALAAGGDAPIRLAYTPSADMLRVYRETLPPLPETMGGGTVLPLVDGMQWAGVGIAFSPEFQVTGRAQSASVQAAQDLCRFLEDKLSVLGKDANVRKMLPEVTEILLPFLPRQQGDGVVIDWQETQLLQAARKIVVPLFCHARERAKQKMSLVTTRAIILSIVMFTDSHDGQWPASLQTLVEEGLISEEGLRCVRLPDKAVGYAYLPPAEPVRKIKEPSKTVIVYEDFDVWPDRGVVVGYADGHVESIADPQMFTELTGKTIPQQGVPETEN